EIDFKPAAFNLSNVLARRPEEYHQKIIDALSGKKADEGEILSIHDRVRFKDENLDKKLVFDRYPRRSFLDHFYSKMPGVEDMRAEKATDISGLTEARYETVSAKEGKNQATLVFAARGTVGANEKKVKVQKKFKVSSKKPEVRCEYILEKLGGGKLDFVFGVEWNFTLLAEDSPDRYITLDGKKYAMNSVGEDSGVDKWSITDEWFRFGAAFKSSNPVTLLHFPVETVSQSEDGFQSNYQGTAFIALQRFRFPPKESSKPYSA
ncbi:MAG: alpha-amylase/4-alpha-glucanotransferase domain-containing protein, partial [Candidatus Desulfatibia sp.]|uniref:alpha-amylase/4-alpha-glucanotransferase domain-containing protein n=1 Tax=Candidatus Desulfatibia sp. TaxID=3101189 RepID=UPI002F2F528C